MSRGGGDAKLGVPRRGQRKEKTSEKKSPKSPDHLKKNGVQRFALRMRERKKCGKKRAKRRGTAQTWAARGGTGISKGKIRALKKRLTVNGEGISLSSSLSRRGGSRRRNEKFHKRQVRGGRARGYERALVRGNRKSTISGESKNAFQKTRPTGRQGGRKDDGEEKIWKHARRKTGGRRGVPEEVPRALDLRAFRPSLEEPPHY